MFITIWLKFLFDEVYNNGLYSHRSVAQITTTGNRYGWSKKVNHKSEEKMHSKVKMTLQKAENLLHVQQHHGKHFYKKTFH